jgi:ATP-dependent Lon protease
MEMGRRVKEQLKRIGGMEFWDINFSDIGQRNTGRNFCLLTRRKRLAID